MHISSTYRPQNQLLPQGNLAATTSYTFSAKERDSETGLSYFGSIYYSSDLSIWLSVDPMAAKYPSLSPYVYCANNPIKLVDPNGEEIGPIDRIFVARLFIGTTYKQELKPTDRTQITAKALKNVDCSELVCRVLAADYVTIGVKHKNTMGLKKMLNDNSKFIKSEDPQMGDIALWEGHIGIVSDVDKDGRIKLIHAKGTYYGVVEEESFQYVDEITKKDFEGFYRPINETYDGKEDLTKNHPIFLNKVIVTPNENKNHKDENHCQ